MAPEITILVASVGSVLSTAGYWAAARWRSRRRNAVDRCGLCGGTLYAPGSYAGPSLVEGVLHCEPCAARLRSRVGTGFAVAWTWAAGLVVVSTGGVAVEGAAFLPIAGMLVAEAALVGGGTLAFMRRKNRLALRALESRGEILPPPARPA